MDNYLAKKLGQTVIRNSAFGLKIELLRIKELFFAGAGATTDTFSLLINNERAIDNGSAQAYQIGTGRPDSAYYEFFRPVAGATAINLTYTSTAGGTAIVFQLIYI